MSFHNFLIQDSWKYKAHQDLEPIPQTFWGILLDLNYTSKKFKQTEKVGYCVSVVHM